MVPPTAHARLGADRGGDAVRGDGGGVSRRRVIGDDERRRRAAPESAGRSQAGGWVDRCGGAGDGGCGRVSAGMGAGIEWPG